MLSAGSQRAAKEPYLQHTNYQLRFPDLKRQDGSHLRPSWNELSQFLGGTALNSKPACFVSYLGSSKGALHSRGPETAFIPGGPSYFLDAQYNVSFWVAERGLQIRLVMKLVYAATPCLLEADTVQPWRRGHSAACC